MDKRKKGTRRTTNVANLLDLACSPGSAILVWEHGGVSDDVEHVPPSLRTHVLVVGRVTDAFRIDASQPHSSDPWAYK